MNNRVEVREKNAKYDVTVDQVDPPSLNVFDQKIEKAVDDFLKD